jgi:hypothetical protein
MRYKQGHARKGCGPCAVRSSQEGVTRQRCPSAPTALALTSLDTASDPGAQRATEQAAKQRPDQPANKDQDGATVHHL